MEGTFCPFLRLPCCNWTWELSPSFVAACLAVTYFEKRIFTNGHVLNAFSDPAYYKDMLFMEGVLSVKPQVKLYGRKETS